MSKEIRQLIAQIFHQELGKEELYIKVGTASEIDLQEQTFTFTPNDDSGPVKDVRMKTITGPAGAKGTAGSLVIEPNNGSLVAVAFASNVSAVCLTVESAKRILMSTDGEIQVEADEVLVDAVTTKFNGGTLGGLIKIEDLTAKLNELRDIVNEHITTYNGHVHGGVSTGGGTSGPVSSTQDNQAPEFNKNDYENPKVLH